LVLDADQAEKIAVEYLAKKKPNSKIMVDGVEPNPISFRIYGTLKDEQETLHDFWVRISKRGVVEGWSVTEKGTRGKS
jgi:hypothetical protein